MTRPFATPKRCFEELLRTVEERGRRERGVEESSGRRMTERRCMVKQLVFAITCRDVWISTDTYKVISFKALRVVPSRRSGCSLTLALWLGGTSLWRCRWVVSAMNTMRRAKPIFYRSLNRWLINGCRDAFFAFCCDPLINSVIEFYSLSEWFG